MALVKSHIPWAIKLKNYPEQVGTLTYNTRAQSPVWRYFDPNEVVVVGGTTSATNAGNYYTQFKPQMKYVFPNGTKKVYTVYWSIAKAKNTISLSEYSGDVKITFTRSFVVNRLGDGAISATSSNNSIAKVSVSGDVVTVTGVGVGSATITVNVAEGTNYLATSATYTVRSSKTQLTIPTVSDTSFTWSGKSFAPTITDAPSTDVVARSGTFSATKVGDYTLTFTIRNTSAYEWADGKTSALSFPWSIAKLKVGKPTSNTREWFSGIDPWQASTYVNVTKVSEPAASANGIGNYVGTYSLKDKSNTCWSDGTTDDVTVTKTIVKKTIVVSFEGGRDHVTYSGGSTADITAGLRNSLIHLNDSSVMNFVTVSGTTSASEPGSYKVTVTLYYPATCVISGSSGSSKQLTWYVDKGSLTKPTLYLGAMSLQIPPGSPVTITRSGTSFSGTITTGSAFNSSYMTLTGSTSISGFGTHSWSISLNDTKHYQWSDGSTGSLSYKLTVKQET